MPRRVNIIHSDNSDSGRARGMEESPFVAAERFELKKQKLLDEAQARAKAAERAQALQDAMSRMGVNMQWQRWDKQSKANSAAGSVSGPCCPLIVYGTKQRTGPLLLPLRGSHGAQTTQ
eukprot:scaffold339880_cov49-Prasinocladus_malaysianus.AAC.2